MQAAQSAPSSRLIVQFIQAATPGQQAEVRRVLLFHGIDVLALNEISTDKRWIVQLPPDFPAGNNEALVSELSLLPFVEFAEPDLLLTPRPTVRPQ